MVLGESLEEIRAEAFRECLSLERIAIPPAVKVVDVSAFKGSLNLTDVVFCVSDEIKEFVSCEAMRGWWNQGDHQMITICFLRRCNIPERLGLVLVRRWKASICEMLSCIPSKTIGDLNAHLDSIDSKLTLCELLIEGTMQPAGSFEDIDLKDCFVYHGREGEIVPNDVTRIVVHPSVKERLGLVLVRRWKASICEMLSCIPSKTFGDLNAHLDSISSKLTLCELLIKGTMQPAGSFEDIDLEDCFVYHGREGEIVPKDVTGIVVHPSVKVIKKKAFQYRYKLTTVILNDRLKEIGEDAFGRCTSLRGIDVPPTVKSIRNGAFIGCSTLSTVILHNGLKEIGREAFSCCTSLRGIDIPPTVKWIKDRAFNECSTLTTVILHDGLEEIGREAFSCCTSLRGIDVPPTVKSIEGSRFRWWYGAFNGCSTLSTVTLHNGLEEIGEGAFARCTLLQGIDVPPTVKSIKDWAFRECSALTYVTLCNGLEEIGVGAFNECTSLQGIDIPPTVESIKESAFYHCSRLMTVTLHDGLEEIGREAFHWCTSLQGIDIPPTVKSIKESAFKQCSRLTTVTLHDGLEEIGWDAFRECTSLERIGIPPTIKAIHNSAFNGCSQLKRVVFLNEIEEFATCEAMRGWWNQGLHENRIHEATLKTYHFLFRCSIPERSVALPLPFRANVFEMLRSIPSKSVRDLNAHLDSIDSKLTLCELLTEEVFPLLEVVIWKSRSTQKSSRDDDLIMNILSYII